MKLTFVPMLQIQRDLYDLPRNMERFNTNLATMTDASTRDLKLPQPVASLGHSGLGFSDLAGLALALADAATTLA